MDAKFEDMLRFGINLKLSGPDEDKQYTQRLTRYLMSLENLDADTEDDETVLVYYKTECSLQVCIKDSTLTFNPLTETSYECIMSVLDFVANLHTLVQEDFKKEGYIHNEFSSETLVEEGSSSEEDDSDDFEWI